MGKSVNRVKQAATDAGLAIEVSPCPLRHGPPQMRPAVSTAMWARSPNPFCLKAHAQARSNSSSSAARIISTLPMPRLFLANRWVALIPNVCAARPALPSAALPPSVISARWTPIWMTPSCALISCGGPLAPPRPCLPSPPKTCTGSQAQNSLQITNARHPSHHPPVNYDSPFPCTPLRHAK